MQKGEFEFHYQNATLPPPYANELTISVTKKSESIKINFKQEYLYRDEISIEEIMQEGFPLDEKYQWEGNLPIIWFDESLILFKKSTLIKDEKKVAKKEPKIWIKYQDEKGGFSEGMPGDTASWEFFLQELIQAVYEKGKMEKALTIRLLLNKKSKSISVSVRPSFVNRILNVSVTEGIKKLNKKVKAYF